MSCTQCHGPTRRDFLKTGLLGGIAVGGFSPLFLNRLAHAMPQDPSIRPSPDRILVVLQFSGGNDGLSTVVPFGHDAYFKLRPKLAIPKNKVLKINDEIGFAPDCEGIRDLYEDGNLAVIQGAGYPNPNRSHFVSMDYWHTATPGDETTPHGWIGRAMDGADPNLKTRNAVVRLGTGRNLAVEGKLHRPLSFKRADTFRWVGPADGEKAFESMNASKKDSDGGKKDTLDFIATIAADASATSKVIRRTVAAYRTPVTYPGTLGGPNPLSLDLRTVAALIDQGFPAHVYYVSLGGFDTHFNQASAHTNLMKQWSSAVKAFWTDLKRLKQDRRVVIMTFSEFGRRTAENYSKGTDHGVAGPMFVYGSPVVGGVYGKHPSLTDLDKGDLKMSVDFRRVYATILKDWLRMDPGKTLKGEWETLPLFTA